MSFAVPYTDLANEALAIKASLVPAFERVLASGRGADRIPSVPLYPGLTEAQQDRVAALIRDFHARC